MRAMLLTRLAARNLGRNKRRSALTLAAIIAGIGLFLLGEAFVAGTEENIIVAAEDTLVGHLTARPAGYPAQGLQHPVDKLLALDAGMRALLDRSTVAWTERTLFTPLASNGRDAIRVRGVGYDPERDERVFPRALWQIRGRMPAPDADEVAIGRGLARLLSLAPGDRLVLQVRTHRGAINALETRVAAVVSTNNPMLDGTTLFAPRALTARLIAAEAPTHVSLRLARRELAEAYRPRLLAALGSQAEVVTWQDETRDLLRLQKVRRRALDVLVLILLALAGLGMANTILMAAHERVREIGTLRSLGMTESKVLGLFLLEGGILGLLGSLLGAAWGGGLALWWSRHPLDFTALAGTGAYGDLSFSTLVYTRLDPGLIPLAIGFGVGMAIVASVYPARVAARMVPAEAVRAD